MWTILSNCWGILSEELYVKISCESKRRRILTIPTKMVHSMDNTHILLEWFERNDFLFVALSKQMLSACVCEAPFLPVFHIAFVFVFVCVCFFITTKRFCKENKNSCWNPVYEACHHLLRLLSWLITPTFAFFLIIWRKKCFLCVCVNEIDFDESIRVLPLRHYL